MRIRDWTFCTPFGRDGGRQCLAEPQDILLLNEGALPSPPTPPPPHTLLIPRCDGETVATLRFVCDPRFVACRISLSSTRHKTLLSSCVQRILDFLGDCMNEHPFSL